MQLILEPLLKIAILIAGLMTAAAYLVLLERWIAAWVQDRIGPNRVGVPLTKIRLFGLGQPIADGVKFVLKGTITPKMVDRAMFVLAPIVIFVASIAAFAVVPFGASIPSEAFPKFLGITSPVELVISPNLDVGLIYVLAISGFAVYGVLLGGWASDNKFSLLGGLRSVAQLISYELPMGLALLGVVLASGSLRLNAIVADQAAAGAWNAFTQPLGFVVFCVAAFAEAARLPFDLPEAEQELVAGYHTEYSGVKLMFFMVAEYLHMILASFLIVVLFLGGWHLWGLTGSAAAVSWPIALLRTGVFLGKVFAVILFFMLTRWSWPRFRFDQLMRLSWKTMIPLGMVNFFVVAAVMEYGDVLVRLLKLSETQTLAAVGWAAFFAAWITTALLIPSAGKSMDKTSSADQA